MKTQKIGNISQGGDRRQMIKRVHFKQLKVNENYPLNQQQSVNIAPKNNGRRYLNRVGSGLANNFNRSCKYIKVSKRNRTVSDVGGSISENNENKLQKKQQKRLNSTIQIKPRRRTSIYTQHIVIDLNNNRQDNHNCKRNQFQVMHPNTNKLKPKVPLSLEIQNLILEDITKEPVLKRKSSKQIKQSLIKPSQTCKHKDIYQPKPSTLFNHIKRQKSAIDNVLKRLFRKMTLNNLLFERNPNSVNLNYQFLDMSELSFISMLFEQVQPPYLHNLNYPTFKFKALQKCPQELQNLIQLCQDKNANGFD